MTGDALAGEELGRRYRQLFLAEAGATVLFAPGLLTGLLPDLALCDVWPTPGVSPVPSPPGRGGHAAARLLP